MDSKSSLTVIALILSSLMLLLTVYCDEEVVRIENLPEDEFPLIRAKLGAEDDIMEKVTTELSKVSGLKISESHF
jgi:hypothetical protein